ncbi:MAG TPA: hybrid sensor histidine kinase/response regulator [Urbifossiella sp.]|nr:hybrid sensor histidine kinase/response regulator [Urbifossiella sp.]
MTGIDPSLFELFRDEVRAHADALSTGLLALEADAANPQGIEPLMRAAHSLKGAARIVGVEPAVRLAHVMEDAFVAAQAGKVAITPADVDRFLQAADVLAGLGALADAGGLPDWAVANEPAVVRLVPEFERFARGEVVAPAPAAVIEPEPQPPQVVVVGSLPDPPPFASVAIPPDPLPVGPDDGLLGLFREELRSHLLVVSAGVAALKAGQLPPRDDAAESLRQIRGAARVMKCAPVAAAAAAVGGYWAALRDAKPDATALGWVRYAVDALASLIDTDADTFDERLKAVSTGLEQLAGVLPQAAPPARRTPPADAGSPPPPPPEPVVVASRPAPSGEAVVRVTAQSLSRLMGLAGESLVQARWLHLFSGSLGKLKKQHEALTGLLDEAYQAAATGRPVDHVAALLADTRQQVAACRTELASQAGDFDDHAGRAEDLNSRLYREVIASRMRPFADGVHGLARTVRDLARALGKQARLVVAGEATDVDRDVLEKLEAPLGHLIRNAVDHGIDPPADRLAAGKPEAGTVRVEARHRAGMLLVTVADDGRGVNLDRLRKKIVERGLSTAELVRQMTEAELLEFLFLPGFSTATGVTEVSGRGVGLDVVLDSVRKVGGNVRVSTKAGQGTTFHLQLPITLSVIRAVVVEVGGEPYAFPHNRIDRLLRVPRADVRSLEHRQFVAVDGQNVGLVVAAQLLDVPAGLAAPAELPVVLLSDASGSYGLVVDRFRGEQDLVVRPLDPRLGKVPNLSAAAVLDDGEPVLIVDVEDLVRSMDQFIQSGSLRRCESRELGPARKKRVLVVDDSITVREVERQLLTQHGYDVTVAVDGMDGWNQVRAGSYDLMVSDVDMPRMTGIQLVKAVRGDDRLKNLPVIIVSYKEREEDRMLGLEVGANYYLTKSSFHDNRFIRAVEDLLGVE